MDDGCTWKLCVTNCGQIAADSDTVTIDCLQELTKALSNSSTVPSPIPYDVPFSNNIKRYRRQTDDNTLYHKHDS